MKHRGFRSVGIIMLFTGLLFACENTERNTQTNKPVPNTLQKDTAAIDASALRVKAGADTTIQNNTLMNSLAPQWTVQEVLRKIPKAKITKKEATPNRHIEGQIDSLITIKSDSTIFMFYSVQGKDMLQSATLNSHGIALANGIEVGMSATEVIGLLEGMEGVKEVPQSILIRAEQTPTSLRMRFEENRLDFIQYDGYVD